MGYSNFSGGAEISSGCIPDIAGGFVDASGEFYCSSAGYTVNVQFNGGVLPVFWATNIGEIVTTGPRTAQVHIHSDVNLTHITLVINSLTTVRNSCAFVAYIARGRSKVHKATDNTVCDPDVNFNDIDPSQLDPYPHGVNDQCQAVQYNCKGERHGGQMSVGNVVDGCSPFEESVQLSVPAIDVRKYSNCPPFLPSGWPGTCQQDSTLDPLVCGLPRCDTGSFAVVDYTGVAFGDCSASTPTYTSANIAAPHLVATLYNMVGSGTIAVCDTRVDELTEAGCSPCALVHSLDCIVTAVDAAGSVVIVDIPINA